MNFSFTVEWLKRGGTEEAKNSMMESTPKWLKDQMTGFSSNPSGALYTYQVDNEKVTIYLSETGDGTSNATTTTYSLPFAALTLTNAVWGTTVPVRDNSATPAGPGRIAISSAGTVINAYPTMAAATAWTNSGSKRGCIAGEITYPIA